MGIISVQIHLLLLLMLVILIFREQQSQARWWVFILDLSFSLINLDFIEHLWKNWGKSVSIKVSFVPSFIQLNDRHFVEKIVGYFYNDLSDSGAFSSLKLSYETPLSIVRSSPWWLLILSFTVLWIDAFVFEVDFEMLFHKSLEPLIVLTREPSTVIRSNCLRSYIIR